MFVLLKSRDMRKLRTLGKKFEARCNLTSALFCLDHVFNSQPNMDGMTAADVSEFLEHFLLFGRTLYRVAVLPTPCQNQNIRKLFCIMPARNNQFLLPHGTFLCNELIGLHVSPSGSNEQGILFHERDLSTGFKQALLNRLRTRLKGEVDVCKQARAFNVCLPFTINGQCNRRNCPLEHPMLNSLNQEWFRLRIRIHLQQILVIQGLRMVQIDPKERIKQFRYRKLVTILSCCSISADFG